MAVIVHGLFPGDEWEVAEPYEHCRGFIWARWAGDVEWRSLDAKEMRAKTPMASELLRAARQGS